MAKEEFPQIPIAKMQLGMTIKLPLFWTNHPFLFNKVVLKERAQIALIKSLDVPYVFLLAGEELLVEDSANELVEELNANLDDVPPDLQLETRKALRISQQRFVKGINNSRDIFSKVTSDPEGAYRLSSALVEDLLGHLKESDAPKLAMVSSGDLDVSITQHGVSVAVLALMIGHALDLVPNELRDIALGSLFHDFGKLKIPDEIRRKRGDYNEHEINFLKMHPKFGFDMLNKSGLIPHSVLEIVLHHHEFIDGSGYPDGLKGKKIPIYTQVVSLANDYESILSSMTLPSPQIALGSLFKNRAGKHEEALVAVLVKILGIYPPGTLVQLSDGSIGKVMMTTNEVKQPHVWACLADGSDAKLRFLQDEGVQIEQVIKIDELSEGSMRVLQADAAISFYFSSMS